MTTLRANLRRLTIAAAVVATLGLSMACIQPDAVVQPPTPAPAQITNPTENCDQMMGQVFADAGQRDWFMNNCSTWPPVPVAQSPVSDENPQCAALRIKQNPSPEDQGWYAANCNGANPPPAQNAPASASLSVPGADTGPDRTDCNQIRGTPYRSDNERLWYFSNCFGRNNSQQSTNQGSTLNRANCGAIAGTPYLSDTERQWYLANCQNQQPQIQQVQQPPVSQQPLQDNGGPGNNRNGNGNGGNRFTGWPYAGN